MRSAVRQQVWNEPPGHGFVLRGWLPVNQLEGESNSSCMSLVENIRLHVTYVVP